MENKDNQISPTLYILIFILFAFLAYGGYLSYKSIDYQILNKLESQKLILPTPIASASAKIQK
jgi:hypothetical protein